jgi:transposase
MSTWAEMPRTPGHAFYDRLQELPSEAGFDAFVEQICKHYCAPRIGAPSLPPGRYFRMIPLARHLNRNASMGTWVRFSRTWH